MQQEPDQVVVKSWQDKRGQQLETMATSARNKQHEKMILFLKYSVSVSFYCWTNVFAKPLRGVF